MLYLLLSSLEMLHFQLEFGKEEVQTANKLIHSHMFLILSNLKSKWAISILPAVLLYYFEQSIVLEGLWTHIEHQQKKYSLDKLTYCSPVMKYAHPPRKFFFRSLLTHRPTVCLGLQATWDQEDLGPSRKQILLFFTLQNCILFIALATFFYRLIQPLKAQFRGFGDKIKRNLFVNLTKVWSILCFKL